KAPNMSYTMYALLVVGGLNTVISVMYYIKVLRVMILDRPLEDVEGRGVTPLPVPMGASMYATLLAAAVFFLGIAWEPLATQSDQGVERFRKVQNLGSVQTAPVRTG